MHGGLQGSLIRMVRKTSDTIKEKGKVSTARGKTKLL